MDHPHYDSIYRPEKKGAPAVTSDATEKLDIKDVPAEHIRLAIAHLGAPRKGATFAPRVHLSRKA